MTASPTLPEASPARPSAGPRPLEGVCVVNLAEQLPGPLAASWLADLGAMVVKIERPGRGDPARAFPPLFALLNRNAASRALDLRDQADAAAARELIAGADVLLDGFRPGKLDALGLGPEALAALNPRLVVCAITGYGQTGPYRDRPGHDLSYQGVAGLLGPWARAERPPGPPHLLLADVAGALHAVIGVLAALRQREATGRGGLVDVALADAVLPFLVQDLALGRLGQTFGRIEDDAAYDVFACSDGRFLTLSIAYEDDAWRRLCAAVDRPDLAGLGRLERVARKGELRGVLADRIGTAPYADWEARLVAADVMCGPVTTVSGESSLLADPHVRVRGLLPAAGEGPLEPLAYLRLALHGAWTPPPITPAPGLGEGAA